MDFTKYVSFLENCSLFFCRADKFEDPYEGATSHFNYQIRPQVYGSAFPPQAFEQISKFNEWSRQWTYINCWHMNEHESAAMWKLYAKTEEAVAIRSTFFKLKEALSSQCFIGTVHYIDYRADWLPEGNAFWPYVHKRKSFEHERELRAVIQELPSGENGITVGSPNPNIGNHVKVSPETLVDNVFVSPTAPNWFAELVKVVTLRYGYAFPVLQSQLSQSPVF